MIKKLASYIRQYKRDSILTPVCMIGEVFMEMLIPFIMAALIDQGINRADVGTAALYGGVMLGAGLGLIMRGGATTGGSDMIARMVHKRFPFISVGSFLFAIDCAVVIAAGFLIGTTEALYALINIFLTAKVMDVVIIGFSGNKACFVISDRWQEISDRIIQDMGRGITHLMSRGGYTGTERPTLLCVISRSEIMAFKRILREIDENAFVIITEAHEAIGDGFTNLRDSGAKPQ